MFVDLRKLPKSTNCSHPKAATASTGTRRLVRNQQWYSKDFAHLLPHELACCLPRLLNAGLQLSHQRLLLPRQHCSRWWEGQ
jgi:hypothetical protein